MKRLNLNNRMSNAEIQAVIEETALHGDATSQYLIAWAAMHHNRISIAWIFVKLAAQGGHYAAKKCLALLENTELEQKTRVKKCLNIMNKEN